MESSGGGGSGQSFTRGGRLSGPNGPTKRKSSNLLGSLGRSSTFNEKHERAKEYGDMMLGNDFGSFSGMPPSSAASVESGYSPAPPTPTLAQSSSQQQQQTPLGTPSQSLAAAFENLKQAMAKRLETWKYLKSVHQGHQTLWFQTIALTKSDLEYHLRQGGSNAAVASLQKRTIRFMYLGLNLSPVLDMPSSGEFLKGLLNLSQEFEQLSDDSLARPRMRAIFRPGSRTARVRSGTLSTPEAFSASDDPGSGLVCPIIPFDLDYFQTFFTLADTFVEVYSKILVTLGGGGGGISINGSSVPPSGHSYRSGSIAGLPPNTGNSLNVPSASSAANFNKGPSPVVTPSMVEMLSKIDNRLKKILAAIIKELDALARQSIRDELAGLDAALGGTMGTQAPELQRRPTGLEE